MPHTFRLGIVVAAAATIITSTFSGCGSSGDAGSSSTASSTTSAEFRESSNPQASPFTLGVGTHVTTTNMTSSLELLCQLDVDSIRDDLHWASTERVKGTKTIPSVIDTYTQQLKENQISPLLILDYGNQHYDNGGKPVTSEGIDGFVNFATFSAGTLAGRVEVYEIWNEWDRSSAPNSAESYFELVKTVAPRIKAANSSAVVLAGAATSDAMKSGWVDSLVQMGVLTYADGISIHPYVHCDGDSRPETWIRNLKTFAENLQRINKGKEVPLYLTEMGWPSHTGYCGNSPEAVGKYVARAMLLVRTVPAIRGLWWYDLKNDGENPAEAEHNFGLVNYDNTPKPAFTALKDTVPVVREGISFIRPWSQPGVVVVEIGDKAGGRVFAIWTENGRSARIQAVLESNSGDRIFKLLVGTGKREEIITAEADDGSELTVSDNPLLIFGAHDLSIEGVNWN